MEKDSALGHSYSTGTVMNGEKSKHASPFSVGWGPFLFILLFLPGLGHSSGHHLCLLVLETFRSDPLLRIVRFLASLAFPVAVGWGT